jgi:hypothetical protein
LLFGVLRILDTGFNKIETGKHGKFHIVPEPGVAFQKVEIARIVLSNVESYYTIIVRSFDNPAALLTNIVMLDEFDEVAAVMIEDL